MSSAIFSAPVAASGHVGLSTNPLKIFPVKDSIGWTKKTVSNGSRTHCMKVMLNLTGCSMIISQVPKILILGLFDFTGMEPNQQQEV